jgi:NAD(P)-dependent dehydrogenase (short-subunit alcohol dehydrogenase family)
LSFSLVGKVAVVTGASRGIGRAIAVELATAGASVVVASRDVSKLQAVVAEIEGLGRLARAVECDIQARENIEKAMTTACTEFGSLDICVANAGLTPRASDAVETTSTEWQEFLDTNLTGTMMTCQEAARIMVGRGRGSIVTVASLEAHIALSGDLPYVVSKHGVIGLTKSFAVECAASNVRVNAVSPGFIQTLDGPPDDEDLNLVRQRVPLGRYGTTSEVARAVVFLASDAASYITGITISVDGGWLAA